LPEKKSCRRLKEIEFVESIPKTRSGKILRRLLKARELGLPEGDISTLRSPKKKIEGNLSKLILLKSILAMISKKMSLKIQIMYLLLILLILQGCQAQDKKDENDIEEIQKTPPILPVKYLYWDCRF
jgi:hypothetical protein